MWCIMSMGLEKLWGITELHCQMVKSTKWLKHKLKAMLGGQYFEQTDGISGFSFPLSFAGGWPEFVAQAL